MSDRTTRILFVSFVQPFPADNGKKVVLEGLVRHLLTHPDVSVDYIILGGGNAVSSPEPRLTFHPMKYRTGRRQLFRALMQSIRRRRPLQQTLLYSDRLRRSIHSRAAALKPDVIVYDTIRVSQFVDDARAFLPQARHILYLDDLFSVRYGAMLRAMDQYADVHVEPLGNFARFVPAFCRPLLNARPVCRYLLKREMRLVEQVEAAEAAKFDVSLLVNDAEVKLLRERSAQDKVATMPVALAGHDESAGPRAYRGGADFVFMGALNVAHNQSSLEYFIANIFDDCVKAVPGLKLRVVGQSPSETLLKLFARYPRSIEWTEWVADLDELFASCSAMLVPLLFGSGVKVKTLEALARGLPVISTNFGAEGIVSNKMESSGIIVENDVRAFPRHMRALLDPQTNTAMRRQAREFFAAKYNAEVSGRRYDAIFGL